MAHKKKYFIFLLVLLFGMLFATFSTCYADDLIPSNQMNVETMQAILEKLVEINSISYTNNANLSGFVTNANVERLTNEWNTNIDLTKFPTLQQLVVSIIDSNRIRIYQNNNEIGNDLPFIRYKENNNSSYIGNSAHFIGENGSDLAGYYYEIAFTNSGTWTWTLKTLAKNSNITMFPNLKANNLITDYSEGTATGIYIPALFTFYKSSFYVQRSTESTYYWKINFNIVEYYNPQPEEPETPTNDTTGTITNNSGDITGSIDLSGIQQGIGNIQNQISGDTQKVINNQNENTQTIVNTISGEVGKISNILTDSADNTIDNTQITSGDIENALGFEIAQDPYSNFWTTLTNNLKNALLGTKRSIDISFQGRTWTISLDEYMVLPTWLTIILIPISTAFFTWVLVRQWKHIFDRLSSGNIDSILKENSEERYF